MRRESRRKNGYGWIPNKFPKPECISPPPCLEKRGSSMYSTWILNLKAKVNCVSENPEELPRLPIFGTAPDFWPESWLAHPSK